MFNLFIKAIFIAASRHLATVYEVWCDIADLPVCGDTFLEHRLGLIWLNKVYAYTYAGGHTSFYVIE